MPAVGQKILMAKEFKGKWRCMEMTTSWKTVVVSQRPSLVHHWTLLARMTIGKKFGAQKGAIVRGLSVYQSQFQVTPGHDPGKHVRSIS